jgi:hypothetical protein
LIDAQAERNGVAPIDAQRVARSRAVLIVAETVTPERHAGDPPSEMRLAFESAEAAPPAR